MPDLPASLANGDIKLPSKQVSYYNLKMFELFFTNQKCINFLQKSPPNHIIQPKPSVLPADCNNVRQLNGVIHDINSAVTNINSGMVSALKKTPGPGHVAHYDPRSDLLKAIRDGKIF